MDAFQLLSLIVTALGIVLCIFSMIFIFLGKKIQGAPGQQQISFKGLEMKTNAVIILVIVSVVIASLPLYFQYDLHLRQYPIEIENLKKQLDDTKKASSDFNVQGIFTDGTSRQPLTGARIRVVRKSEYPPVYIATLGPTDDQGTLTQTLKLEGTRDQLSLTAEKENYYTQEILISAGGVIFPANLIKKK